MGIPMKRRTIFLAAIALCSIHLPAWAADVAVNSPAIHGYDPVTYITEKKAMPGHGEFAMDYKGSTYLFASEKNKETFEADPERYLPAYGGYCAYGVSLGRKIDGDPNVWEVVNGKTYLNLNTSIQGEWKKDL